LLICSGLKRERFWVTCMRPLRRKEENTGGRGGQYIQNKSGRMEKMPARLEEKNGEKKAKVNGKGGRFWPREKVPALKERGKKEPYKEGRKKN